MSAPSTTSSPRPAAEGGRRPARDWLTVVVPAVLAYVPLLLTAPGVVGADTKTYLYLDPGGILRDAPYLWDEQVGFGTVTHQTIGYLFPMGPYYWLMEALGVPDWTAQRLWLGSVLFAAAMGVRFLVRTLGGADRSRRAGLLVAALAYMLSPYFLAYAARISVILLPWAALPWLIALTARAVRRGGWRDPAWFALVVLVVGGINATALLLVGLGPLLWLVWAVWVEREATVREAVAAGARIGALTLATSLWWIAGLWAQGRFGLPVIRYTETYKTVAEASNAPEVLRGLGYWFFYGTDKLGPWIEPSVSYTNDVPLLTLSYALPVLALLGAALVRWRHRAFVCALVVVGGLAAVGGHPWQAGSVLGRAFTAMTRTDAGLSLRSTPRAVPLVVLGTSLLLGALVTALGRRLPRLAVPVAGLACLLVVLNLPPLWSGTLVADNLQRDEDLPTYWLDAADWLDARGDDTRILEVPGTDFASYRWGNTVDPVTPGLLGRPYAARELFQWGSAQSADLLNAYDRRLHEDSMDPRSVAEIARLLGVGDLVARNDLQYERFRTARPRQLWDLLVRSPGLGDPVGFGDPAPNVAGPEQTLVDEIELGTDPTLPDPPPVAAFPVEDPLPILRTHVAEHPLLAAADGEGIVDAAAAGVLDADQALFSSAWFADDPDGFATVYDQDADLLVTDTNRRRAHRWGSLREITGYTEQAGEEPPGYDPTDQRLEVFPTSGDDAATVTVLRPRSEPGITTGARVTATDYGNPITYTPDDRPALALDGDLDTAWRAGALGDPVGERLVIELDEPVTVGSVNLVQPLTLERNRWITDLRLHFDDGSSVDVALDERSRDEDGSGQDVGFAPRQITRLELEVLGTNVGWRPRYEGLSGVGFAEVRVPGVGIEELVRPPMDLLEAAGPSSLDHRLTWVLTRLRSNPAEPVRGDEEEAMRRLLSVPTARSVSVAGTARLSAFAGDDVIDALVGLPDAAAGGVTATSGRRLAGSLRDRASAAIDGDPTTSWTNFFQQQREAFLRFELPAPITVDRLDLQVVADGRHSVPTRVRIEAAVDGAAPTPVAGLDLPPIADGDQPGATVTVPLDLPSPITTDTVIVVVEQVRQVPTRDWYSNLPTILPVAIAEVGIPGIALAPATGELPGTCRDDLLTIDGAPVAVQVAGTVDDALDRGELAVVPCGATTGGVDLDAGEHVVRTASGRDAGVGIDQLRLASAAGGAALPPEALPRDVPPGPPVEVTGDGRVSDEAVVRHLDGPFWLVLGQSHSEGWTLAVDGVDQGPPVLADGFANGWLVDPGDATEVEVALAWWPQRVVWVALALSALAALVTVGLALLGRRSPRRRPPVPADAARPDDPSLVWPPLQPVAVVDRRGTALVVGATVVAAALNLPAGPPLLALLPVAAVAWLACRWRRGSSLPAAVAAAALAASAAYAVVRQLRYRFPADFAWPTELDRVHVLGVVALLLLGVQALRDLAQPRGPGASDTDPEDRAILPDRSP